MNFDQYTSWDSKLQEDLFNENVNERNSLCCPKDLEDFMSNEDFLRPILTPVNKCPGEVILMMLKHALSCKLPLTQISNLFKLVNNIFTEPILPKSKYFIGRIFSSIQNVEFHSICPNCHIFIGKITDQVSFVTCKICKEKVDLSNPSCPNIFLIMDVSKTIKVHMKEHENYYEYIAKDRKYDGTINSIYDGKSYRKFVKSLKNDEKYRYLTAILITDGAPRFESSQYSIWPVYLKLNEIPSNLNGNNVIPIAMWFGKNKPDMAAFLDPLTTFLNKLSQDGIPCEIKNAEVNIKLYVIMVCVDSVARAPMQGFKQFNGNYGCNQCYHPGQYFAGCIRYPVLKSQVKQRTMVDTIEHITTLVNESKKDHYGSKDVTPLINLSSLDIIVGFVPDYMHCCLSGVGKQITELIISDLSSYNLIALDNIYYK